MVAWPLRRAADVAEIAGNNAPTEVAEEAGFAVIRAATQPIIPTYTAQSSLDPSTPAIATTPRSRSFSCPLGLAHHPRAGNDQVLHPRLLDHALVVGGMDAPIRSDQPRRSPGHLLMVRQGWLQLSLFGGLVFEHRHPADNPALHLIDHQPPKFHRRSALMPGDDPRVWLEDTHDLLFGWHLLPVEDPLPRLTDDLLYQRECLIDLADQSLCLCLPLAADRSEGVTDLLCLLDRRLRRGQEGHIDPFPLLGFVLAEAPSEPMQGLQSPPHRPHPGSKGVPDPSQLLSDQRLAPSDGTAEDTDPVSEEGAVGGMVDGRLHRRPIDSQLPPLGHLGLSCQRHPPIIESVQRLGPDGVGPALQRAEIGHRLNVDPTEPPQDDTVSYPLLGFTITPVIEVLHDQQPEDRLTGRGVAAVEWRPWTSVRR